MSNHPAQSNREVYCEDAISWLGSRAVLTGCSLVTSLPDISEFPSFSLATWKDWFLKTAQLVLAHTPADGVSVFYQSDIKVDGTWVDKGYLCQKAAEEQAHELLWHKIVCRVTPGQCTFGRPAYSHILCFSKGVRFNPQLSTPDVLPNLGKKTWERGMGLDACLMIAKFIRQQTTSTTVVNPFCGQGSMLAAAEALGLQTIGIERSPKRAEMARLLKLNTQMSDYL